jgi:hypothetical protein
MRQLIDNLRYFNSKERFFMIGHILGNAAFAPCGSFRKTVETAFNVRIPDQLFAAMDYHLDWLYASLYLTFNEGSGLDVFENRSQIIKGQQEDIDFLMAFAHESICHVILVEAKGVTGWSNQQMNSKAMRFGEIFGSDGNAWPGVKPHFLLLSPQESSHLNISRWPSWMAVGGKPIWSKLAVPAQLKKVTRCDSGGFADSGGVFWRVDSRGNPSRVSRSSGGPGLNYRGSLRFADIIEKCRREGDKVVVGYLGGINAIRGEDFESLTKRRVYKWDCAQESVGSKVWRNWIPGGEFFRVLRERFPDRVGK